MNSLLQSSMARRSTAKGRKKAGLAVIGCNYDEIVNSTCLEGGVKDKFAMIIALNIRIRQVAAHYGLTAQDV